MRPAAVMLWVKCLNARWNCYLSDSIPSKGQGEKNKGLKMCFTAALLWSSAITAKLSAIDLLLQCALGALFSVWTCTSYEITDWFSCGWVSPWLGCSPCYCTVHPPQTCYVLFQIWDWDPFQLEIYWIVFFLLLLSVFVSRLLFLFMTLSVWCLDFILPFGEAPKTEAFCSVSSLQQWYNHTRLQIQHQKCQIHTWSRHWRTCPHSSAGSFQLMHVLPRLNVYNQQRNSWEGRGGNLVICMTKAEFIVCSRAPDLSL